MFIRFLPLVISLYILGAFLSTRPKVANQMWSNFSTRVGLVTTPTPQPFDPLELINQQRTKSGINSLARVDKLDETARLLAVALSNNIDQKQFTLEQAAQIAGYTYNQISFMALSYGQPSITPPSEILLSQDNLDELLKKVYSQVGIAQVRPRSPDHCAR